MITTIQGQTIWTFEEPTLEQITSGDYILPVNFKIVDSSNSKYKLVSFVRDSEKGIRRLDFEETKLSIEDFNFEKLYKKGDLVCFNGFKGTVNGIYRCDNDTTEAPFMHYNSSFESIPEYSNNFRVIDCYIHGMTDLKPLETALLGETVLYNLRGGSLFNGNSFCILCTNLNEEIAAETTIYDMENYYVENFQMVYKMGYQDLPACQEITEDDLFYNEDGENILYKLVSCPYTDNYEYYIGQSNDWTLLAEPNKQIDFPDVKRKYSTNEVYLGFQSGLGDVYAQSFIHEKVIDPYENLTENVYFDLTSNNIKRFLEVSAIKQLSEIDNENIVSYGEVFQMIAGMNYSVTNQAIFHNYNHNAPMGPQNIQIAYNNKIMRIYFTIVYLKN